MKVCAYLFAFYWGILATSPETVFAAQDCEEVSRFRARLESADPVDEAERVIESGRLKFLGVYGYALSVPGVEQEYYACYSKKVAVEGVEGTTDFVRCPDHEALNAIARTYAEKFNQRVLQHMNQIGDRCNADIMQQSPTSKP